MELLYVYCVLVQKCKISLTLDKKMFATVERSSADRLLLIRSQELEKKNTMKKKQR